jgi:predicted esterase
MRNFGEQSPDPSLIRPQDVTPEPIMSDSTIFRRMRLRAAASGVCSAGWTALVCLFAACSGNGAMQTPATTAGAGGVAGAPASSGTGGASASGSAGQRSSSGAAGTNGGAAGGRSAAAGGGGAIAGSDASDEDAGASGSAGDAAAGSGAGPGLPRTMQPIDPPVADDCIKDVSAGDHTFSCGGLTYLMLVDPMCTKYACGLIFYIHGATMSGAQMRDNTLLYKIAPPKGFIVVNPSATASNTGGTWDLTNNPPTVAEFMDRTIKVFHVDPKRIHVGGFSQGSIMTFWFLCNRKDILASAAPVSGATDVACLDDSWPRIPIFYENGSKDQASTIDTAHTMVDKIVSQLKLTGGMQIAGDGHYTRKHWQGDRGMLFDYIEHDYGGQPVLDGHCIPGGVDKSGSGKNNYSLNATTCTTGDIQINWGELALQWYIDHPKQ